MIFVDAINIFGAKGGSANYLIDFSLVSKPTFESELKPTEIEVFLLNYKK